MNELEKKTMRSQQAILGWLGILLPVMCIGFGLIGYFRGVNEPGWYESISATYYANSRMCMIGLLFASGIYYWAYRGYDLWDSIVTDVAAVMAFCVVAFPCSDGRATSEELVGIFCLPIGVSGTIHNIVAIVLYVTFFVQTLRFTRTAGEMTPQKKMRNRVYYSCAALMIVGSLFILCVNVVPALEEYHYLVLVGECFLQLAFGTAWLVKGECVKALNDKE
ncbi:MAG: hypothetical protein HUK02_02715 [Bacteroidaceae bacterium]|nr:hypothetical protein [Bacteroidaceae bacterium]